MKVVPLKTVPQLHQAERGLLSRTGKARCGAFWRPAGASVEPSTCRTLIV